MAVTHEVIDAVLDLTRNAFEGTIASALVVGAAHTVPVAVLRAVAHRAVGSFEARRALARAA